MKRLQKFFFLMTKSGQRSWLIKKRWGKVEKKVTNNKIRSGEVKKMNNKLKVVGKISKNKDYYCGIQERKPL